MINKPKCAFHPQELIINFCKKLQCNLPLCSLCIKIHTQQHKQRSTFGQFQTLNTIITDMKYNINSVQRILISNSNQLGRQFEKKKKREIEIRKKIKDTKNKYMLQVQRYFDEIQKKLLRTMNFYNQMIEDMYKKINQNIMSIEQEIHQSLDGLISQKELKVIIKYYQNQHFQKWKQNLQIIQNQLENFEKTQIKLQINNFMQDFYQQSKNFITLVVENGRYKSQQASFNKHFQSRTASLRSKQLED